MTQAVILAAGEGQRLRPFTGTRPKVMLNIGGKPIIQHVIEALSTSNIRDIIIVVGYHKEQIYDSLGSGESFQANIQYVVQTHQLGTAHALKEAQALIRDDFFVVSGDNLITKDTINDFITAKPNSILLTTLPENNSTRYGIAMLDDQGNISAIIEKPSQPCDGLINTGIYHLTKEIFDFIADDSGLPSVINRMINNGLAFKAVETRRLWLDAVYPWDINQLNGVVLKDLSTDLSGMIEKGVSVRHAFATGANTIVRSGCYINGPVRIGSNCEIGPNTVIEASTTIGDNVSVGPFCHIQNCVIGSDVVISASSTLHDSVIDDGNYIGPHFIATSEETEIRFDNELHKVTAGVLMGANCKLGSRVCSEPGTLVGSNCYIKSGRTVSGRIKDESQLA